MRVDLGCECIQRRRSATTSPPLQRHKKVELPLNPPPALPHSRGGPGGIPAEHEGELGVLGEDVGEEGDPSQPVVHLVRHPEVTRQAGAGITGQKALQTKRNR